VSTAEPSRAGLLDCAHFVAGRCRSCTLLETPYAAQLAGKQASVEALLADVASGLDWLPPVSSPQAGFRNKAKMVVAGTVEQPSLGILGPSGEGVDLRDCALHTPGIVAALPVLAGFVTLAGLTPYDVAQRRGELKHVLVTESPDGELMVRLVLRSQEPVARVRKHLPALLERLPTARVVSVNLQPEHKAILEGEREIVLGPDQTLTMRVNDLPLHLRPQGFFQTNTAVAAALYAQASSWIEEVAPASVVDLYCGVGGFALHAARGTSGTSGTSGSSGSSGASGGPVREVVGVEISAEAVAGARRTADEVGLPHVRFEAADVEAALRPPTGGEPAPGTVAGPFGGRLFDGVDLVVVNPPRRGIGADLAAALESSAVADVIYSSCNAVTLARDLAAMPSLRPVAGQVLDMFPNTGHYEVLVRLERERLA
jgi:23S rRNA (uracil747-C5)-methyltransferase